MRVVKNCSDGMLIKYVIKFDFLNGKIGGF